jgi:hypothetical protein
VDITTLQIETYNEKLQFEVKLDHKQVFSAIEDEFYEVKIHITSEE